MLSACFILNRIIVKDSEKTPYEIWKRRTPNLNILKVWGRLAKVSIPKLKGKKIGPKTVDAIFIGYAHNSSANQFLVTNSEVSDLLNNTIIESRNATYFEDTFPFKSRIPNQVHQTPTNSSPSSSNIPSSSTNTPLIEPQLELKRSKRPRIEKNLGEGFYTFLLEGDPTTYNEAICHL